MSVSRLTAQSSPLLPGSSPIQINQQYMKTNCYHTSPAKLRDHSKAKPMANNNTKQQQHQHHHIVLLPFMAQGHISPFLSLAELIHRRHPDFTVTLVNTTANISSLSSSSSSSSSINLRSLPFTPSDHGLPPNAESTALVPFHLFPAFFRASHSLLPAFRNLIKEITAQESAPPLCIIADNFFASTVDVAREFNTSHAVFFTSGAYGTAVLTSLWRHLPHNKTNSDEFPLPDHPDVYVHRSQLPSHLLAADGTDQWSAFFQPNISNSLRSDSILVHTAEHLEPKGLIMLRKAAGSVPVWPVGPLLRRAADAHSPEFAGWLDRHPASSVVYVSFGSQNTITAQQMMELAKGLAASGRPFVWVIRPPVGFDINGEFRPEWLPEGFEEREQGMVVHGWAPQVEILSHPATGAFLSHCGWNSVLESLGSGVPIIGWPLSADQMYNSVMLEEMGVCVEVARGNKESTKVEGLEVERVIRVVLGEAEMRRKAAELAEVLKEAWKEEEGGGGSSSRALSDFLNAAIERRVAH